MHVFIDDKQVRVSGKVSGGNHCRTLNFEAQSYRFVNFDVDDKLLEVENDCGNIFDYARDAAEFVKNSVDLYATYGRAGKRRKKHPAKSIAKSLAITSLERLEGYDTVIRTFAFSILDFGSVDFNHAN